MKSLLRYPGGKTRACKFLYEYIPKDVGLVISPFLGGGSFELYLCEKGIEVKAYDYFEDLYIFWECLLENKEKLHSKVVELYPMTKDRFKNLQDTVSSLKCRYERAAAFYSLNRSSFSGSTISGGMSPNTPRFNLNSLDRILKFEEPLLSVSFSDFKKVIIDNKKEFLFLDPPYYIKNFLYGKKGDKHKFFDHEVLHELLKYCDKFILCYNDCDYIRNLYKDYKIVELNWSYGMNKSKKSSEILIIKGD